MRFSAIALLLAALLSAPAEAQNAQTREGFWISFGLGYGSLGCDDCDDERTSGTNVYLRMGGTLSQRSLLGGEVNAWTKSEDGTTLTVSTIGPIFMFYPNPSGGLYLKGGLGLANISIDLGQFTIEENGVGLTLGLGYDARVGQRFALTPYFDIVASNYDGGSLNQVSFGLGFTWP